MFYKSKSKNCFDGNVIPPTLERNVYLMTPFHCSILHLLKYSLRGYSLFHLFILTAICPLSFKFSKDTFLIMNRKSGSYFFFIFKYSRPLCFNSKLNFLLANIFGQWYSQLSFIEPYLCWLHYTLHKKSMRHSLSSSICHIEYNFCNIFFDYKEYHFVSQAIWG